MTKRYVWALAGLLTMWPAAARADSGFLEWIDSFSGPGPFWGASYETRVFCVAKDHTIGKCVSDVRSPDPMKEIQWVVSAEGGFYSSGDNQRFADTPSDTRSVHLVSLVPKVMYRVRPWLDVGGGIGLMALSGDGFDVVTRAQVPFSASITPLAFLTGPTERWGRFFRVHLSEIYVAKGLSGADLNSPSTYSKGGEFHKAIAFVFDFGVFRAP